VTIRPVCISTSLAILLVIVISGCAVEASKTGITEKDEIISAGKPETNSATSGATIAIKAGSPSETVRAFYAKLRERKIREAIFLTNLRPAIEGLTDEELKEFAVDFDAIAKNVPSVIEINGEIISGDAATVTAKLPDDNNEKLVVQQIRLRKEGEHWLILSADEEAEKAIRKEGKNYFHVLRIDTHHEEARKMLDRIATAQLLFALQNKGQFADFAKLIATGTVPADIATAESTGYHFAINVAPDAMSYLVSAIPAVYGKSGKLSFTLEPGRDGKAKMQSADNGGKPIGQ
jgi:hypothetical protein